MISGEWKLHLDPWCNDEALDGFASYHPADPLAVALIFWCPTRREHIVWEFALDLLWPDSQDEPGGDVRVGWGEHVVSIAFSSPNGKATVYVDQTAVQGFLDDVARARPTAAGIDAYLQAGAADIEHRLQGMDGHSHP